MVRGAIYFLNRNRVRLGVDSVELHDNASHWCDGDPNFPVRLVFSRQLLGQFPYYWQFGFRSVSDVVVDRIRFNVANVLKYPLVCPIATTKNILDYITSKFEISQELHTEIETEYIKRSESSDRLVDYLRWLSDEHCQLFFYLYEDLFRDLGLVDPYRFQDSRWKLHL
jgi:hypothetical protein